MSRPTLYSLTYVSSAASPFTAEDLQRLSDVSVRNNQRDGLTGALIFKDDTFMQVLEGDEPKVCAAFARIGRDPRHRGLITLLRGDIRERQFPDWSMRVEVVSGAAAAANPPGDFARMLLAKSEAPARHNTTALLMTFAGLRGAAVHGIQRR